ncbi:MAG: VOC family protein [Chloroflexi bacterium]|nr:VOC family protein [Chloroflexota bacterium]
MNAQFRSSVLFVKDMTVSRHFYEQLLGQQVDMDFGFFVGYVGGLALWDVQAVFEVIFHHAPEGDARFGRDNLEIYFEIEDLDAALRSLMAEGVNLVHPIVEQPWAQRVLRAYDPDGHIIELAEPMQIVVHRLTASGLSKEAIHERTAMPIAFIEQTLTGKTDV